MRRSRAPGCAIWARLGRARPAHAPSGRSHRTDHLRGYAGGVSTPVAETAPREERAWWLRVPAVLLSPRPVFAALRDDSDEAARARSEPVAAIVGIAGIAGALLSPVARQILNDPANSRIVIPVWAFIGGTLEGLAMYFVLGGFLYAAA